MKKIELGEKLSHNIKKGQGCPEVEPNVFEDSIFLDNGVPVGLYLRETGGRFAELAEPEVYEKQKKLMEKINEKWKIGNIFTSSISNSNIAANFHLDTANIVGTVNAIITKRENSVGGYLHVPDYNLTFEQPDGSVLIYPAWKNLHGVTPIKKTKSTGYRNTLIFYPLKAFME